MFNFLRDKTWKPQIIMPLHIKNLSIVWHFKTRWFIHSNLSFDILLEQICGSQIWDTGFSLQVILAADDDDEIIRSTLIKGYDFLKKSQVTENPPGDHLKMFRHITKGRWNFPDKDQGLPVSDCTAESLEVASLS